MTPSDTTPQGSEPREDGFTSLNGLWKDLSLSRLERVRAHRAEFGSLLRPAIEAVDEEEARQIIASKAAPAAPTNGGGGWNSPLARSFTTVESIGHAEPERREATIKMRFQGEDAAERAHDALAYLGRLHEAALQPQPTQQGGAEALADVAAERQRQVESEGWSVAHDDQHDTAQMAKAAAAYALSSAGFSKEAAFEIFPWAWSWWKPSDSRRDLVKAAALLIAEIERLDRITSEARG